MKISAKLVKELRDKTGAGMMDCKRALVEKEGDLEAAKDYLLKKGLAAAKKKAGRIASEGVIGSYIHMGGKIGVMVEVNCETDFVAKTDGFIGFVDDLTMHIAAMAPEYLSVEDIPAEVVAKQKDIFEGQGLELGKPAHIVSKIAEGRVKKWQKEICLLDQPFVKDTDKTVKEVVDELVSTIGEKISIRRFVMYVRGEGLEKRENNLAAEIAAMKK